MEHEIIEFILLLSWLAILYLGVYENFHILALRLGGTGIIIILLGFFVKCERWDRSLGVPSNLLTDLENWKPLCLMPSLLLFDPVYCILQRGTEHNLGLFHKKEYK